MLLTSHRTVYLSLIILFLFPLPARAVPAISCHCFTNRSYDPARPTLADPYFLATTQNSFFAAAFAVDKKTIVMKKQKGASAADLWVAYWLSSRTGRDAESLLQMRKTQGTWREVAASLGIPATMSGKRFAEAVKGNATDEGLADIVVDGLLVRFRFYDEAGLAALRTAGAANPEVILASLIAFKTEQPSIQLYTDVKKGSNSWGRLLDRAKIAPSDIQKEIEGMINRSR